MRIRSRLLILFLSVLIPAFITASIGIYYVYSETQEANRQSMREVAQALALVVDREMMKREAVLQTLATSSALDKGDLQQFYVEAKRVAPTIETSIMLSDLHGQVLLNTQLPYKPGARVAMPLLQNLREEAGPEATVISDIYTSPIGNQPSFTIQVPVKRDGILIYFLEMNVFVSQLQSVFREQRLPNTWNGSILDRNGIIAARNRNADRFVGRPARSTIVSMMRESLEGFNNDGTALTGEPVTAFFSRAPRSDWRFLISVPQIEFKRSAYNAITVIAFLSLVFFGLSVAVAVLLGRNAANAVEKLQDSAEKLGRGEPVTPMRSGVREFDAVSEAMAQASQSLEHTHTEMERRVKEAVAMSERSQRALLQGQKLEALGRLTGGIAHDFNNILQTLTTGLQLSLMSITGERERNLLQSCQRAVARGGELARQLMAFGRVQEARLETLDVSDHLKTTLPLLTGALPSNIAFALKTAPDLWQVTIDPLQFELALLNLTINARDAMPEGGTITLEAENECFTSAMHELHAGDYVRIRLIDTGAGMSEDVSARAFDPFFTTKKIGKGSGMGLPQVYGFTKQSGGALLLHSREGSGTTITIYLPRAEQDAFLPKLDSNTVPAQTIKGSILFVEDDALVRETIAPALSVAGLDVCVAQTGEQAVEILESNQQINLVFSDIVMPGTISGIELAHIIRDRFPHIRVVLATGYSEQRVNLPGIRMLAKPYSMNEVIAVLSQELPADTPQ
ncbi:ATP-binding protein [uncultured Oxalicibacterium sp.]|uniref:hybrid sensor histidine kinase/response regulator n=1 Tax=uncultured Oxalicibacterium sp. TaxID=1168540 RepID=UPI0025F6F92B|nr:ATP-binding protein [uncultured Oxalicibacterium sp.]